MEQGMFVGIDVSKGRLDVALGPQGELLRVANEAEAITALVERLRQLGPALVVLEASGALESAVVAELGAAQLPVVVVNPRQPRKLAQALGQLAKSDTIDARLLALFGERVRPQPRLLASAQERELKARCARRRQLVEMLVAEHNRLERAPAVLKPELRSHLDWLRKRLKRLDHEIDQFLRN
jgi:transposase